MKFYTNLDLNNNQLMNVSIHNLGGAPSTPVKGQVYFNTSTGINRAFVWDGSSWVGMDGKDSAMTGTNIVSAINASSDRIDDDNLSLNANSAFTKLGLITVENAINLDTLKSAVALNTGKVSNATHTGDVTGATALTIGDNKVTLDKLAKMSTAQVLGRKSAGSGNVEALTKVDLLNLLNVADGAQVNTVVSVNGKTGALSVTKGDVGLGSVTNDAQVKKSASSISGNVPVWDGVTGDSLGAGYGVETTLTGSNSKIPRADAVKIYVDNLLGANDAMVFKGVLDCAANPNYPAADAGHAYKISVAGKIGGAAGPVVEIGDMIICIADATVTGTHAAVGNKWTIIQGNIDGAVTGPAAGVANNFVAFDGTSGRLIKDSGLSSSSFAPATHTHNYTRKYTTTVGGAATQVITHNLGTRDLAVTLRETAAGFNQVYTDIEFTTTNTLTVKFAQAPTTNQFTITVVG